MSKPDFADARIKLARANEHIADVERRIEAFLATDFYRLTIEPNEREGQIELNFESIHDIDKSTNAAIGDAIGNLRSSLDYIVVAIVAPITGKTNDIGFPFADNQKGFAGRTASTAGLGCGPQILIDHFVNEIQAYEGGKGHLFWSLNKLRNIDKHRLLLATTNMRAIKVDCYAGSIPLLGNTIWVPHNRKTTAISVPLQTGMKITGKPEPLFQVLLDEPASGCDGLEVTDFLKRCSRSVESLLNPLEVLLT